MNKFKKFTSGLLATSIIAGGFLSIGTNSFADSNDTFEEFIEELKEDNVKIPSKNLDKVKALYKEIIKLEIKEDQAKTDEEEDKIDDQIDKLEQKVYDLGVAIDSNYKKGDDDYLKHDNDDDYDYDDRLEDVVDDIDDTRDFDEFLKELNNIGVKIPNYNLKTIKELYNELKELDITEDKAKTEKEEDEIESKIDELEHKMYEMLGKDVGVYLHSYNIDKDDLSEKTLKEANDIFIKLVDLKDDEKQREEYIKLRYLVGIDKKDDYDENKKIKSFEDVITKDLNGSMYEFNKFEQEEKEELKTLYKHMKEDLKANRYDWVVEELEEMEDIYEDQADDLLK